MPCPPHSPRFDLPNDIWWWVQIMKLPHCATFSILSLLHPPSVQPFPSAPCSHTPSVYALPLKLQTKFQTHTKQLAQLWFCIF
jgi:hypothetical protein